MNTWRNKQFIVTGIVIAIAVLPLTFFPVATDVPASFQAFILSATVLVALPLLYVRYIVGVPMTALGFRLGHRFSDSVFEGALLVLVVSLLFLIRATWPEFGTWHLPAVPATDFWYFLLYEGVFQLWISFLLAFFFMGFMQTFWLSEFGLWGLVITVATFFFFMWSMDSLVAARLPLILGFVAGAVASSRSRSLFSGFAMLWAILFCTDIITLISKRL